MIAVLNGQEFEGSILRVHSTGFSFADCRDGDGQYCGVCRVCLAYESGVADASSDIEKI